MSNSLEQTDSIRFNTNNSIFHKKINVHLVSPNFDYKKKNKTYYWQKW